MSSTDRRASEAECRGALYAAQRALMHAQKWYGAAPWNVKTFIDETLIEVSRVLDIGRDEENEMVAT